jgi:DNA polymerase
MPTYVPGVGPFQPKLMIIGEAPGKLENDTGLPFVGPSGKMLDNFLYHAGISRADVYITNVVKYQPPFNDFTKLHLINVDLKKSIEDLWNKEIKMLQPNAILAVGDQALQATTGLSGILNYRGSILHSRDNEFKVIPTIHPAALFHHGENNGGLSYVYSKLIQHDIRRAVEESNSRRFDLPVRDLKIINSSLELFRYLREHERIDKVAVDIESISSVAVSVGFSFSRYHAISIPLYSKIGEVQVSDMSEKELTECWRMIDTTLKTKKLIGQNLKYDEFKLRLVGFRPGNIYSDTLIKTRVIFPELPDKDLGTLASIWTREPYYKDQGKEFKVGKSDFQKFFIYNARDCAVNYEVDDAQEEDLIGLETRYNIPLRSYYYDYQMRKHKIYLQMENNGFAIDSSFKDFLSLKYENLQREQHQKLTELVGRDVNVKSPPQILRLLHELEIRPHIKAPTSEDAIVSYINSQCKGKDGQRKKIILETKLEESRIRDQKSRYIDFEPDYDGRCKSSFNIIATETCRSSTSILKKPLRPEKSGLAFHTISKHGRLAKDIRSMFVPDKGKIFLQADSSQAEARIVAVLCRDFKLLEAFDTIDIHRRTAALVLGLSQTLDLSVGKHISDSIGKDSAERFIGKKTRHAGNYDMKKRRFMTEVNTDSQKFEIDLEISEWKAGTMLEKFHAASPKIKSIFHQEIKDAINSDRTIIDPFGGIRIFNGRLDESLYQEAYANLPQRTVSHLVQGALISAVDELGDEIGSVRSSSPVNLISENHDSLLWQVPESNWQQYAILLKGLMTKPIDFSLYCTLKRDFILTIPCDIEIGVENYASMEKVKL